MKIIHDKFKNFENSGYWELLYYEKLDWRSFETKTPKFPNNSKISIPFDDEKWFFSSATTFFLEWFSSNEQKMKNCCWWHTWSDGVTRRINVTLPSGDQLSKLFLVYPRDFFLRNIIIFIFLQSSLKIGILQRQRWWTIWWFGIFLVAIGFISLLNGHHTRSFS